jgi:hypothetical protein
MTLDTAKRIVRERGEVACKEALAIVRGGMTICEKNVDGSRKYIWVKIMPTKTDEESSIELALKMHNQKQQPIPRPSTKAIYAPTKAIVEGPTATIHSEPTIPKKMDNPDSNRVHPFLQLIAYLKKKFEEFVKVMDDFVEE